MTQIRFAIPAALMVAGLFVVTSCGNGAPATGVGVPGAAPVVVPVTPSTSASTTAPPTTTLVGSTIPPTTSTSATTVVEPPTTTAPPTTLVAATTTAPPAPTTTVSATTTTVLLYEPEPETGGLVVGGEGPRTLQLQQDLILLGHLPAGADDGQYGPGTAGGVRRFQDAEGLVMDGVAGPITLAAIATAVGDLAADT